MEALHAEINILIDQAIAEHEAKYHKESKDSVFTEDFMAFWKVWPGRWNRDTGQTQKIGKQEACTVWKKLSQTDKDFIMTIVPNKVKVKGTEFLPDAHRWLKKKLYNDFR